MQRSSGLVYRANVRSCPIENSVDAKLGQQDRECCFDSKTQREKRLAPEAPLSWAKRGRGPAENQPYTGTEVARGVPKLRARRAAAPPERNTNSTKARLIGTAGVDETEEAAIAPLSDLLCGLFYYSVFQPVHQRHKKKR